MAELFAENDSGYLSWVEAHPKGYVANISAKGTSYCVLHHASHHLSSRGSPRPNGRTHTYHKLVGMDF